MLTLTNNNNKKKTNQEENCPFGAVQVQLKLID